MRDILFLIIFLSFQVCFGQDYIIEYQKSKDLGNAKEIMLPFNYELRVSGNKSSFKATGELPVNEKFGRGKVLGRLVFSDSGQEVVVYDSNSKNHMSYSSFLGNPAVIENNPLVEWEITNESQMIGEYLCYKAIGNLKDVVGLKGDKGKGRSYEAWFTPSIPIKVGPPFYYNLPGLVLFGTDQNGVSYLVQKIKQEKPGSVVLEKMPEIRHINYSDYVEQMIFFIRENSR